VNALTEEVNSLTEEVNSLTLFGFGANSLKNTVSLPPTQLARAHLMMKARKTITHPGIGH
jgi:hypothetical protein